MIYAAILAGGKGSRLGNVEIPKQFLKIGKKPIIIHTIEKFIVVPEIKEIIVLSPKSWVEQTKDLIVKHLGENHNITVIAGGAKRNDTIDNCIQHIEDNYGITEEDILVTHDAVRPFLSYRIIKDNIDLGLKYGAVDTVIEATDTIIEARDNETINDIPNRNFLYMGQTPQTFNIKKLRDITETLTEEEKDILTDACKIFTMKGEKVYLVKGEQSNIKITYQYDLDIANYIVGKGNLS